MDVCPEPRPKPLDRSVEFFLNRQYRNRTAWLRTQFVDGNSVGWKCRQSVCNPRMYDRTVVQRQPPHVVQRGGSRARRRPYDVCVGASSRGDHNSLSGTRRWRWRDMHLNAATPRANQSSQGVTTSLAEFLPDGWSNDQSSQPFVTCPSQDISVQGEVFYIPGISFSSYPQSNLFHTELAPNLSKVSTQRPRQDTRVRPE